ncbi:hypothetical protein GCM10009410_08660 [Shewanella ulleungensis]|uniref:Uncharacterized protein n=1 Tax=Shewanella ulleungensis TaxID=2282699 RepID=A0ABQ2QEW3_9GAMM|nr:hypothetical protein GCM10009410_08660 [Shewanella ulleungensis]
MLEKLNNIAVVATNAVRNEIIIRGTLFLKIDVILVRLQYLAKLDYLYSAVQIPIILRMITSLIELV